MATDPQSNDPYEGHVRPHSCAQCNTMILPGELVKIRIDFYRNWTSPLDEMRFRTRTMNEVHLSLADLHEMSTSGCAFAINLVSQLTKQVGKDLSWEVVEIFSEHDLEKMEFRALVSLEALYKDRGSFSKASNPRNCYVRAARVPASRETCKLTVEKGYAVSEPLTARGLLSPEPLSTMTINSIKTWLQCCEEEQQASHIVCSLSEAQFIPSRLIAVEAFGAEYKLQLIESLRTLDSQYAALSYCWGGPQLKQLTKDNIETYKKSIPWGDVPPTLQDAAKTTHMLGLRYLWVDSMCIIQSGDDGRDKSKEISRMTKVYTHATFTIMARRGDSVNHGFLHPRTLPFGTSRVQYRSEDGQHNWVTLTFDSALKVEEKANATLNTRGWAMQEYLLSRRLVQFGPWSTDWSCRTKRGIYSDGNPFDVDTHTLSAPRIRPWRLESESTHSYSMQSVDKCDLTDAIMFFSGNPEYQHYRLPSRNHVHHAWNKLVVAYTHRSLSVATDRALAISGLAERFSPLASAGQRYVAGLWECRLPNGLLWANRYTKRNEMQSKRPAAYKGPTWSWIAMDNPVYHMESLDNICNVLDVECELVDSDARFGAVCSAVLTIEGPSMSIEWRYEVNPNATSCEETFYFRIPWEEDRHQDIDSQGFYVWLDNQEQPSDWMELVLLALGDGRVETRGLALVHDNHNRGRLRRIGFFNFYHSEKSLAPVKDWPVKTLSII